MTEQEYWKMFEQTGDIENYLNYRRSLGAYGAKDGYDNENDDGRTGDMGEQDRRSGSGDYPFDA